MTVLSLILLPDSAAQKYMLVCLPLSLMRKAEVIRMGVRQHLYAVNSFEEYKLTANNNNDSSSQTLFPKTPTSLRLVCQGSVVVQLF